MSYSRITDLFPDKLYLSLLFHRRMGYWMDWKHPRTFNEKLQWLKLYNRKPEYTIMADKIKAKEWVAERIGAEYIIPTLGVWDDPEDIDFDKLPNQFVLKCNHNSGLGMYICKDKSKMDVETVKQGLREGLKENYYLHGREWPYKDVPRKILAEQFMVNEADEVGRTFRDNTDNGLIIQHDSSDEFNKGGLTDYKFTCFNGVVDNVMVCIDRALGDTKFYFFDRDWNLLPLNKRGAATPKDFKLPCPPVINKMFEIAAQLSVGMPYLRVDLYYINNKIYFGETTFFPQSGFDYNLLPDTDRIFGERINLSIVKPSKH